MLVLIKTRQQEQWGGSISNTLFLNTQTVRRVAVCFFPLYIKHIFLRIEARLIVTHKVSHHQVNKDDSDHQRYQSRAEQIFFFYFPHVLPICPSRHVSHCLLSPPVPPVYSFAAAPPLSPRLRPSTDTPFLHQGRLIELIVVFAAIRTWI